MKMTQKFKLIFPNPGIDVDDYPAGFTERLLGFILLAAATVLIVALLLASELRLTPEQRLDLFEASSLSP
jgi:hypothetical protein